MFTEFEKSLLTTKEKEAYKKICETYKVKDFNEFGLYGQIVRAHEVYKNKDLWKALQTNAMEADYSWKYSAREYVRLYKKAIILKNEHNPREKSI